MRRLKGAMFLSLDGVMQAPGGPTEDPTGGFPYGGWVGSFFDETAFATIGEWFTPPYALLLGRRTYDIFAAHWPYVSGNEAAMGEALTAADKYVLTRSDLAPGWVNSQRLQDIDAVAALKASDGPDLLIQGSSTIYPPLLAAGLIDELSVMTFPVLLGQGKRPWQGAPGGALDMIDHKVSKTGVVIATYRPAGAVGAASFGLSEPSAAETERQRRIAAGDW